MNKLRHIVVGAAALLVFAAPATAQFMTQSQPTSLPASSVTVGITAITGGSTGNVPYNNAGILGEMTTSGSGTVLCLVTSCAMVTPSLGVATATTINKVTITAPATSATFALTNGKTFNVQNSLTLAGTDTASLNIAGGGTLGSNAFTSTAYAPLASPTFTGTVTNPDGGTFTSTVGLAIGTTASGFSTDKVLSFRSSNNYVYLTGSASGGLVLVGDGANSAQNINIAGGASATIAFVTAGATRLTIGTTGIFTLNTTNYASCTAFVTNASAVFSGTCSSAIRFKDPLEPLPDLASVAMTMRTDIWKYKPQYQGQPTFDGKEHVSLIADDVARLDPRCAMYGQDGLVRNYEDRCVATHLWALWKSDHARLLRDDALLGTLMGKPASLGFWARVKWAAGL